jgi:hypothetical protein
MPNKIFALQLFVNYSRSRRLGFREGSLERKPKINKETKKITVV